MLVVAIPKSASTSLLATLGELHDLPARQLHCPERPALEVEIPVFNQNKGGIARARAELEQAARRYEAVRQNIICEVKQAYARYVSAYEQSDLWSGDIIPPLEQAFEQTKKSYEAGDVSLISVLHAQSELFQARMYLTELVARLKSSTAELSYCIGKKIT